MSAKDVKFGADAREQSAAVLESIDAQRSAAAMLQALPAEQRGKARRLGLFMAMFMRIGLLLVLVDVI